MPSHLNGLNIIQPAHSDPDSQDLLSGPFPDLSAWTHLPFEIEDGHSPVVTNDLGFGNDEELGGHGIGVEAAAIHDGHVNIVTGTAVNNSYLRQNQFPSPPMSVPSLDLASLLSSFAVNQQLQPVQQAALSLAQLLSAHTEDPSSRHSSVSPHVVPLPTDSISQALPPAIRQRSRKASVSAEESSPPSKETPLIPSEDKRRRNTAASARFRLKKKEREIALENKAKELETKVNALERECEGLRRENGWLKGLVVGVTGAAQTSSAI